MTSRRRSLLVNWGLVVLACLSTLLVAVTSSTISREEREARRHHLVPAFRVEQVQFLRREGPEAFAIARAAPEKDERFQIVEPIQAVADEAVVDQLLQNIRFATWLRRVPSDDVDRNAFGLVTPELSWSFQTTEGTVQLRLGANSPSPPGSRYLEIRSEQASEPGVVVVSESVAKELDVTLAALRVRELLPVPESKMRSITFLADSQQLRLVRERSAWHFAERFRGARLSEHAVDRLLLQFARTQARDFLAVDSAEAVQAQTTDLFRVEVTTKEQDEWVLVVGGPCPEAQERTVVVRVQPEPLAACVTTELSVELIHRAELLLDESLFRFRIDEVEELTIQGQDKKLELVRRGDGFLLRSPVHAPVDREAGLSRLEALLSVRGEWVNKAPQELDLGEPDLRVTVTRGGARESQVSSETIELWTEPSAPAQWARRAADGALLAIANTAAQSFALDASLVRDRTLLDLKSEEVVAVDVSWEDKRQVLKRSPTGNFELPQPVGFSADAGLALDMVDALRTLRTPGWVSEQSAPHHGFAKPRVVVDFTVVPEGQSAPVNHELIVGARAPQGGHYATLDSQGVFLLPRQVIETLTTWVVDRSVFLPDPSTLSWWEITTPRGRFGFSRLGRSWVQRSGAALSEGRLTEVVDALSQLRPEFAASVSGAEPVHGLEHPVLQMEAKRVAGSSEPIRLRIGAQDVVRDLNVHYAQRDDQPVVFALPRHQVRALLELL